MRCGLYQFWLLLCGQGIMVGEMLHLCDGIFPSQGAFCEVGQTGGNHICSAAEAEFIRVTALTDFFVKLCLDWTCLKCLVTLYLKR